MPVSINNVYATCDYGVVGEITSFGISNPNDGNPFDQCIVNDLNKACTPDNAVMVDLIQSFVGQTNPSGAFSSSDIFNPGSGAGCLSNDSQIFIQFSCTISQDQMYTKYRQLSLYACITVFVALFYYLRIRHLIEKTNINHADWDLATVTAGDYTVQKLITPAEYISWLETHYKDGYYEGEKLPVGYAY